MNGVLDNKILAGIVLYNSDFNRLLGCLESIDRQVERIIIYDNSPNRLNADKEELIKNRYKVIYVFSNWIRCRNRNNS